MEGVGRGGRDHYNAHGCFEVGGAHHGKAVLSPVLFLSLRTRVWNNTSEQGKEKTYQSPRTV